MTKTQQLQPYPGDDVNGPVYWQPSRAFLRNAVIAILVWAAVALIALRVFAPAQTVRSVGPILMSLVAVGGWFFLARGRILIALKILAIGSWVAVTVAAVFTGGVRAPVIVAYPPVIIIIGLVIGSRTALAAAMVTTATTVAFVLADEWRFLPTPPPAMPALPAIILITVLLVSTVVVIVLAHSYQNRLREMRKVGSDLAQRTADLEANRAEMNWAQGVAKTGSWVYELATDTMRLSAEACRILGLPEDAGSNYEAYLARVHPQDRSAVDRAWQEALRAAALDVEHRVVVGESIRWVRQSAELEFGADGKPLRAVGSTQDITERKAAEEKINNLAYYDPLTQLPNRRLLQDRIKQALASCSRSGHGGALFFIDLDNFKTLNDTLGHDIGDLLLQQVAQRLGTCVREVDTVARLGGDEFVVLLADLSERPEEAAERARTVGEKLLAILDQPYLLVEHAYQATASIGVTLFGSRPMTVSDLLKQADIAMYQAKAGGRNALSFFAAPLPPSDDDTVHNDLLETRARG